MARRQKEPLTNCEFTVDLKKPSFVNKRASQLFRIQVSCLVCNFDLISHPTIAIVNIDGRPATSALVHNKRHHYMAKGIHSQAVAAKFLEHANEEQGHTDQIAERIMQLDGEPNFSPEGMLTRSHSEYVEGATLLEMIREDLISERIAIESYAEIVRYLGDNDPTSRP
jgi:DNA-binding ferritin-like protein